MTADLSPRVVHRPTEEVSLALELGDDHPRERAGSCEAADPWKLPPEPESETGSHGRQLPSTAPHSAADEPRDGHPDRPRTLELQLRLLEYGERAGRWN